MSQKEKEIKQKTDTIVRAQKILKNQEAENDKQLRKALLPKYNLLKRIGSGSFGVVYEAVRKVANGRPRACAIKVSKRDSKQITKEAEVIVKAKGESPINSEFVINVIETFRVLESQAIVMPLMEFNLKELCVKVVLNMN